MKYKDVIFEGATFPDDPIRKVQVKFSREMINEYMPEILKINANKGLKSLAIIMAQKEGFYKGTRAFRLNNPGNIGNTDMGANKGFKTLNEGIRYQLAFLMNVANGYSRAYVYGKEYNIKPYYSEEIAKNYETYRMEPYVPGYRFVYNGSLEQFVKIYSTGARAGNGYLKLIISYFKNLGYEITPKTTLKEIISLTL